MARRAGALAGVGCRVKPTGVSCLGMRRAKIGVQNGMVTRLRKFALFGRSAAADLAYRPGPSRWNDLERGGTHRPGALRVTLHSQLDGV